MSGDMHRALAVTLLAPTAMHLQHTNIHVPFRTLILFQLGNFAVAVAWASGMPCWLSLPASSSWAAGAAPGPMVIKHFLDPTYVSGGSTCSAAGAAADVAASLQNSAEQLCTRVRALQLLLSLLVPVSCLPGLINPQSSTPCKGPSAYQVLYLFFAAQLLLVLPLTVGYLMEWWAKSCWLNASGIVVTQKPFIFRVTRAQLESAGSRGAGASTTEPGTARVLQWWLAMPLLLLLVQLPWVVAEALVGRMQGVCRPVWGARGFAWMSGLW